jgi:hypothetical protein
VRGTGKDNISARTFEKLIYQNVTLYLDALMNQESAVSLQDKRLRFIEDVGKAIAANYDLQLNAEFAYLTGRYLTSLPLAPRSVAEPARLVMQRWLESSAGLAQRIAGNYWMSSITNTICSSIRLTAWRLPLSSAMRLMRPAAEK